MSYTLTYAKGGLADAAEYLKSKGRGEDTQLIHMTPGEIDALQALAEQHGGSLTINPETGLPEAGWLGNILKVAAPVALSFIPGVGPLASSIGGAFGASGALASGIGMGLLSGGLTALTTGSLKEGLGAGITGGIMGGLSAPAAQTANIATASGVDAATKAAQLAAQNTAVNTGLNQAGTSMMTNPSIIAAGAKPVAMTAASGPLSGISDWYGGLSGPKKLGYGLAGVAGLGMIGDALAPKFKTPEIDKGSIRPYTYASTTATPSPYPTGPMYDANGNPILARNEQNYFNQGYTELPAYKAAEGGLMAAGGLNNMYPQSQQYSNEYASSTSSPLSSEVIGSGYEQKVNQYTGEPIGYALGGSAKSKNPNPYSYNPETQQYTQAQPAIKNDVNLNNNNSRPSFMYGSTNPNPMVLGMGGLQDPNGGMYGFNRMNAPQTQQTPKASNQYTYDPATQTYVKVAPTPVATQQPRMPIGTGEMYGMGRNQFGNYPLGTGDMYGNGMSNFGDGARNIFNKIANQQNYTYDPVTQQYAKMANGGIADLGDYSDGGRLLKGPGDGVSDSIPASIGNKQPARLADGEFVIPARIVSELGNGSTDAGAKRLYAMMDKIQAGRKKTVGKGKVAVDSKAAKHLPA